MIILIIIIINFIVLILPNINGFAYKSMYYIPQSLNCTEKILKNYEECEETAKFQWSITLDDYFYESSKFCCFIWYSLDCEINIVAKCNQQYSQQLQLQTENIYKSMCDSISSARKSVKCWWTTDKIITTSIVGGITAILATCICAFCAVRKYQSKPLTPKLVKDVISGKIFQAKYFKGTTTTTTIPTKVTETTTLPSLTSTSPSTSRSLIRAKSLPLPKGSLTKPKLIKRPWSQILPKTTPPMKPPRRTVPASTITEPLPLQAADTKPKLPTVNRSFLHPSPSPLPSQAADTKPKLPTVNRSFLHPSPPSPSEIPPPKPPRLSKLPRSLTMPIATSQSTSTVKPSTSLTPAEQQQIDLSQFVKSKFISESLPNINDLYDTKTTTTALSTGLAKSTPNLIQQTTKPSTSLTLAEQQQIDSSQFVKSKFISESLPNINDLYDTKTTTTSLSTGLAKSTPNLIQQTTTPNLTETIAKNLKQTAADQISNILFIDNNFNDNNLL